MEIKNQDWLQEPYKTIKLQDFVDFVNYVKERTNNDDKINKFAKEVLEKNGI